ncbi:acyltransferase [Desulfosporosinus meridiei]|uniref:Putative acyltransferase n=1 Tax=Desulfosporosinus meridiei (strain ATCC BAA-275 / DSM 13257 / KCTC 12902 / NCIMB 13706 / S10) TaxID=768704 RepID=J7J4E5_DESMD|nr:acyltransferase [Desulfosporosinus meridiei]AFQ46153.1 putative acyltransferase [Desulfosporosinus meridiei DSM 13257]
MIHSRANHGKPGMIEEIGYLRGFGVLAVIAIHTTGYFTEVKEFNTLVLVNLWTDIFSQFAVPLFVMISGFVLAKNYYGKFSLGVYYRKRMRSIVPQYFLFSVLYTAFNNWIVMNNNSWGKNLELIAKNIWQAEASYHLWFFSIIIQLYLLYPLIVKLYAFFRQRDKAGLLVVIFLVIQTAYMVGIHSSYLAGTKLNFMGFLFYFSLGLYWQDYFSTYKKNFNLPISILFAMSLALTLGCSFFIIIGLKTGHSYSTIPEYFFMGPELIYPAFRTITFLLLFAVSSSLLEKKKSVIARVINKIGDYSFGIYLIHIFFNQSAIKFLRNYQIDFDNWAFYIIVFAVTLILSYISVRLISFIPYSYYLIGSQNKKR